MCLRIKVWQSDSEGKIILVSFLVLYSVGLHTKLELEAMVERMKSAWLHTINLTENDLVKDHLQHLVIISLSLSLCWKWIIRLHLSWALVDQVNCEACCSFSLDLYTWVYLIFKFLDIALFFAARANHYICTSLLPTEREWEVYYWNFIFRNNMVANKKCTRFISSWSYKEVMLK